MDRVAVAAQSGPTQPKLIAMILQTRLEGLIYRVASVLVAVVPSLIRSINGTAISTGAMVGFTLLGIALWLNYAGRWRRALRAFCFALIALSVGGMLLPGREILGVGSSLAVLFCSAAIVLNTGQRSGRRLVGQAMTLLAALLAIAALLMETLTDSTSLQFLRAEWVMAPASSALTLLAVAALAVAWGAVGAAVKLLQGQSPLRVAATLLALVLVPAVFVRGLDHLITGESAATVALPALVLVSTVTYALMVSLVIAMVNMRREAAALAKSQQWFSRAWDSSGIGMALVAKDGSWLSVNARLARIVGYSDAELRHMTFQDITHPDDLALDLGELQKVLDGQSEGYEIRKRYFHRDGHTVWIQLNVVKLTDVQGNLECLLSQIQDVTARVEAEAELARTLDALEDRIDERTRELQIINAELDAFTQSVSHDLRAPLRAVDGFSRILLQTKASQLDEESQRYLTRIRAGSQRMGELIDGLLQLSRISRKPLAPVALDLAEIARQVVDDLRTAEPGRVVEFSCPEKIPAWGDPALLRSVMINVLGNAWKYSVGQPVARITVDAQGTPGLLHCRISDNGSGFNMAYRGKLFQAFQRLHTEAEAPGFGLGLATVRRIITKHGGRCDISAGLGAGTVFEMELPRHDQAN